MKGEKQISQISTPTFSPRSPDFTRLSRCAPHISLFINAPHPHHTQQHPHQMTSQGASLLDTKNNSNTNAYNTLTEDTTTHIEINKQKFRPGFLNLFLSPSIYLLYIVMTSLQELPMTSIAYILNNEAGFSPAQLMTYYNLCFMTWCFKPLYALVSDNISFCGYRRKPWLILCSLVASATFVLMVLYGIKDKTKMQVFGLVQSLCICVCEIQVDALVVALTNVLHRHQQDLYAKYPFFLPESEQEQQQDGTSSSSPKDDTVVKKITTTVLGSKVVDYEQVLQDHPELYTELTHHEYKLLTTPSIKASIQSEAMTCRTIASLGAAFVSMILHLFVTPHIVLYITAGVPILTIVLLSQIPEYNAALDNDLAMNDKEAKIGKQHQAQQQEEDEQQPKTCLQYSWGRLVALFQAAILLWKPLLFVLFLRSMPTATDPLMSYIFGELNLPPWLLSAYSFISVAGGLVATLIYWKYLSHRSLVGTFIIGTVLAALTSLPTACLTAQCNVSWFHIPNYAYVIITTMISAMTSRIALMPSLTLAIESYPSHNTELKLEATMFTTYTAMNNIGAVISYSASLSMLHFFKITSSDFSHLPDMLVACAVASLIPLITLPLISCNQKELEKDAALQKQLEAEEKIAKAEQEKHAEQQVENQKELFLINAQYSDHSPRTPVNVEFTKQNNTTAPHQRGLQHQGSAILGAL